MAITIDSTTYNVDITIVERSVDALDKYAERTQSGKLQRELIGVYFNYRVSCGMSYRNVSDYAALFLKLSEAAEFHTITNMPGAPSGYGTFECYIADVKDELYRYNKAGVDYFKRLSFSIVARQPSRTPA